MNILKLETLFIVNAILSIITFVYLLFLDVSGWGAFIAETSLLLSCFTNLKLSMDLTEE